MSSILTIPNLLTFMRMALIPVFASLLYYGYSTWALAVFVIAGVSDGIDGFWLAALIRNRNLER